MVINYLNGQIIYGDLSKARVMLPCPFCGATPKITKSPIKGYDGWFDISISCPECHGAAFSTYTTDDRTEQEAYDELFGKWNKRNA